MRKGRNLVKIGCTLAAAAVVCTASVVAVAGDEAETTDRDTVRVPKVRLVNKVPERTDVRQLNEISCSF